MRKVWRRSMITFAYCLVGSAPFAQKGTLNGTVTGAGEPLQAVTVTAGANNVLTDKRGWFSLSLDAGFYTFIISHAGYKTVAQEVKITSSDTQTLHFRLAPAEEMSEVVVLGSRSSVQRTYLQTPVPVDVIAAKQLTQTGQPSLTQMLNFAAPSFNASRPLINEPVTLRGLNPDQLLILVNGTRRHNMAYVNPGGVRGILGRGAVANDLNAIPFSAIEKIEILRDGASAQYGSDAIAGVINIQLKKQTNETSVQLHTGQFYKGDGKSVTAGLNTGFSLFRKGFLNISADFRYNNPTHRGGEYWGTVYTDNKTVDDSIVRARGFNRKAVSNAGSSKQTSGGLSLNGGYPVSANTELFWTAMVSSRKTIFTSGFIFPKNTTRINPELFPDGFSALPHHNSRDASGIAGARGRLKNNWHWEYSTAYGINHDRYAINNTNNPSQYFTMGKLAPTSFYTGTLVYGQLTNSINLSKQLSLKPEQVVNVSAGAEWRREYFITKEGEEGSWKNYFPQGRKVGGSTGLIVTPESAVNESRNVAGTFVEIESEYKNRLLLNLAGRYEYYSDYGGNLAGKLAARYKITNKFSIRGSINNGFRAPSLQQRYFASTNKNTAPVGGVLIPVTVGLFPNNSEVARAIGIPTLQAERSVNGSGGATATITSHIRLTVDAYWIQIKNRIVLSGMFDRTKSRDIHDLLSRYPDVDRVQFFANAINTRTHGLDMVLNGNWKFKSVNLFAMLAGNWNQTRLFGDIQTAGKLKMDSLNTNTLFSRGERGKLEQGQPPSKVILSLHVETSRFGVIIRNTWFGKTAIVSDSLDRSLDESFSPKILTDVSFHYTPMPWLRVTAGANNILNIYPDHISNARNTMEGQHIYPLEASPFGFNGGYYFITFQIKLPPVQGKG
ncbi:MAG TPA: TonB-dependent receptor [Flavisolibacter sp.]|nr:TonB-dependent receptor [Flavisolibacter sp.]